jgi:hypothetical protein
MKTGKILRATTVSRPRAFGKAAFFAALVCASGCTHVAKHHARQNARLAEHSRALTTAVVDTLHLQPQERRDAFTSVALELAQHDQRIEGIPLEPISVTHLLGTETNLSPAEAMTKQNAARNDLDRRLGDIQQLRTQQRASEDQLIAYGERFEEARNAQRTRVFQRAVAVVLTVGAIVALIVFVPASIPLLGRILAFCVAKFPALAGSTGIVSVKAFDAVVKAIEQLRATAGNSAQFGNQVELSRVPGELEFHLSREMDAAHKALVRQRKAALRLAR